MNVYSGWARYGSQVRDSVVSEDFRDTIHQCMVFSSFPIVAVSIEIADAVEDEVDVKVGGILVNRKCGLVLSIDMGHDITADLICRFWIP